MHDLSLPWDHSSFMHYSWVWGRDLEGVSFGPEQLIFVQSGASKVGNAGI